MVDSQEVGHYSVGEPSKVLSVEKFSLFRNCEGQLGRNGLRLQCPVWAEIAAFRARPDLFSLSMAGFLS